MGAEAIGLALYPGRPALKSITQRGSSVSVIDQTHSVYKTFGKYVLPLRPFHSPTTQPYHQAYRKYSLANFQAAIPPGIDGLVTLVLDGRIR